MATPHPFTSQELGLVDSIWLSMTVANAIDGLHAYEDGGTWGSLKEALLQAMDIAIVGKDSLVVSAETWEEAHLTSLSVYAIVTQTGELPSVAIQTLYGSDVMDEKCEHGFSIHSRCPVGCDEEFGGINEKETGWTGR